MQGELSATDRESSEVSFVDFLVASAKNLRPVWGCSGKDILKVALPIAFVVTCDVPRKIEVKVFPVEF